MGGRVGKLERNKVDKIYELGNKSIPKLLLGYSVTTFFALFLNSIYSITDALFVGYGVGIDALGAISAVFPFTILQGAISTMIGGGAAILVSNLLGKNKREHAADIVLSAAVLFWLISLVITAFGLIFIDQLIDILGVADSLQAYAKEYLTIILIGNIFSTGFSSVMRAEGKMLYALLQWVIPVSLNIVLDAIFLLVLDMGVKGAAYATVASQVFSVLMALLFFIKFSTLKFRHARFRVRTLVSVLSVGLPSLVQQGSIAIALTLLNSVLNYIGGDSLQITYGIVNKIFTICIVPFSAIAQALQPIAGFNYGAKRRDRVTLAIKWTILYSFVAAIVPLIICESMPHLLMRIFTKDTMVIKDGAIALRYIAIAYPIMFLPSTVGALFQAIGKKLSASLLFAINFIFIPPLATMLGVLCEQSYVWLSFPLAGLIASLIAVLPFIYFIKKSNSKVELNAENIHSN